MTDEILTFVNSKDIRKHLKEIGYQFNALEAAWLVWQSRDSTLEERHIAWKQIIAKYPDRPIPERMNTIPQPSLHRFLEEYMDMENRVLEHFLDPSDAVYQVEYCFHDAEPVKESRVYSRFEPEKMSFVLADEDDVKSVRCIRLPVNGADESALHMVFSVRLDAQKRIIEVDLDPGFLEGRDKELKMGVFGGFWFDFPTPFQKGDILWDPNKADGFCGGPFVCTGINLHEKGFEYMYRDADDSDMTARGLFVNAEYGIYRECMSNYMNCEYYPKELAGIRKLLMSFSAYEKGDSDAELLFHACRYIMLDTEKKHTGLHWYTAETLKKAGIMIQ